MIVSQSIVLYFKEESFFSKQVLSLTCRPVIELGEIRKGKSKCFHQNQNVYLLG